MPWKETCAMKLKNEMINDWLTREYSIMELSDCYDVSRKTIYKWLGRYHEKGLVGLEELSREPYDHPNATPVEIVEAFWP
jgi:transposase